MIDSRPYPAESENLSIAWCKAFQRALELPQSNPPPMVVSITGFKNDEPFEVAPIRDRLDRLLKTFRRNSCRVSAMVVFPYREWVRHGRPSCEDFSSWCLDYFAPRLKDRCPRMNRKGLYFERMMDFKPRASGTSKVVNQLQHIIDWYRQQQSHGQSRPSRSRMQVACFSPAIDHNHECRPFFPCLQQVGFSYDPHPGGGLTVNAFYPTQLLFDRAYGNYLGLCGLGAFMAHQLGLRLVRVNCFIGRAEISGAMARRDLRPLSKLVNEVLSEAGEDTGDD